ncbi:MAG: hypothetical protein JXR16_08535 [Bermanella sp.]
MRRITQLLIYIAIIFSLYVWLAPIVRDLWLQPKAVQHSSEKARSSSFFPLEDNQWLTFDIANQSRLFRFYFHAALLPANEIKSLSYEIQYQWLGDNGNVLSENIYHINTRQSPYIPVIKEAEPLIDKTAAGEPKKTEETMTMLPSRFYNHNRSEPSLDQSLYLAPSEQPSAKQLRFRVHALGEGIEKIGLRSYIQYQRDQRDVDIAWQRMSNTQRESITSASVYPSFLLSMYERQNIMSAYWKPIGPLGVLDKDYRIETLYLRENSEPTLPQEAIVNEGLFASPNHWLTVKLEKPFSRYRIQWQGVTPLQLSTPTSMKLHWQGEDTQNQRFWSEDVTKQIWEGELASGLLKIIPDSKGIFKLYHFEDGIWQDITPEKLRSRAYLCTPNSSLQYSLASGEEAQSIKINARNFYRSDQSHSLTNSIVNFYTVNSEGAALIKDAIVLVNNPNHYQQFNDTALIDSHVFESSYRYLTAKNNSKRLYVKCSSPALISVSTRPWKHPIYQVLPRDRNYWHAYPEREPAWFSLEPERAQQLKTNKQYHSLIWYLQPIETNAVIASGQFSWEALENQNPTAVEKELFTKNQSDTATRLEARASSFVEIKAIQKISIAGRNEQEKLRVSVVYLRDTDRPEVIEVWVDSEMVLKTTVVGRNGRLRLPSLTSAEHKIEFRSSDSNIRWFINNTIQSNRSHLLRSAYPLLVDTTLVNNKKLYSVTLPFYINGEGQQLALWLFSPVSSDLINCDLVLRGQRLKGSQKAHSFRRYKYTISSSDYPVSHVLKQKNKQVQGPISLFVQLNQDLPKQQASVTLTCDKAGLLSSGGIISFDENSFYDFREKIDAQ